MQLPDFIKRMLGHVDKVEARLDALDKTSSELETARQRIAVLETEKAEFEVKINHLATEKKNAETAKLTPLGERLLGLVSWNG